MMEKINKITEYKKTIKELEVNIDILKNNNDIINSSNEKIKLKLDKFVYENSKLNNNMFQLKEDLEKNEKEINDLKCIINLCENDKILYEKTISKLRNKIKEITNEKQFVYNNLSNLGKDFFNKYPKWE